MEKQTNNKTALELQAEIEQEVNPTGNLGLKIGTVFARLQYAEQMAESALRNLQTVYEGNGNDRMAELTKECLHRFYAVMGKES